MTLRNVRRTSLVLNPLTIIGLCLLTSFAVLFVNSNKQSAKVLDSQTDSENVQTMPNLTGEKAEEYLKEHGLYKSLGEAMAASRYSIHPTKNAPLPKYKEAFEANNPRQAFSTYFAKDGIHLVSRAKNNKWRVQMNLKGYSQGDELTELEETKAEVQKNKSRIEIEKVGEGRGTRGKGRGTRGKGRGARDKGRETRDEGQGTRDEGQGTRDEGQGTRDEGQDKTESKIQNRKPKIVEWYENKSGGLEQGWTINEKLTDSEDKLKLILELGGDLKPKLASDKQAINFVKGKNDEQVLRYDKLKSWDANGKELTSRMELKDKELSIVVEDKDAKYPITVDPFFTQTKKLTASDAGEGDEFGDAVAISGDTAIVGAYDNDEAGFDNGSAYIFARNQGGANNWGEVKKLVVSETATYDYFGSAVGVSGDTVIVGANGNSTGGAVFIYERNKGGIDNWGEVKKVTASDTGGNFGSAVGISGDTVIVGATGNDNGSGVNSGSAYIYERNKGGIENWGQVKKLIASNTSSFEYFGNSVGISVDTVIVGAYLSDAVGTNRGSAYIFARNKGGADNWGEVKQLNNSLGGRFGDSVGISGDTAIVGATRTEEEGTTSGSAYIYERNKGGADNWGEVKKIIGSSVGFHTMFGKSVGISRDVLIVGTVVGGSAYIFERNTGGADNWGETQALSTSFPNYDNFSRSVAISGDTAIVGAPLNDDDGTDSGSAYIFTNVHNNWQEVAAPLASDGTAVDNFGWSVAISGDTAIIGAYRDDDDGFDSGSAYIFERNTGGTANNWGEVKKLTASDAAADDFFGYSVGISRDTAIVGAWQNDDDGNSSGSAYIFERNTGGTSDNWGEVKKLTASDAAADDLFGRAVGISGDTAIIGAYGNDDAANSSGSAYIFERNTGGTANNWGEVKKLTASDAAPNDLFGRAVGISGDTAIVGAHSNDDAGSQSGSAYIFERNTGGIADNWGEVKKLTASDADVHDFFGYSVGISGDTAIVGAYFNDDGGSSSGSAYIFERNTGGIVDNWGEVKKLTASDAAANDSFGVSVGISVDTAIIGAPGNDDGGDNSGSTYIFERNTGGTSNNWGEVKKLTASDAGVSDLFGRSVGISGDTAIVGANGNDIAAPFAEKSSFKGKSTTSNLAGADQGRVYIFNALAAPTAANASIAGRVTLSKGRGLSRTTVHLTDQNGNIKTARTNQFGYFRFEDIEVGQTLVLNAYHKGYQFNSQIINLDDSITDLIITPQ